MNIQNNNHKNRLNMIIVLFLHFSAIQAENHRTMRNGAIHLFGLDSLEWRVRHMTRARGGNSLMKFFAFNLIFKPKATGEHGARVQLVFEIINDRK